MRKANLMTLVLPLILAAHAMADETRVRIINPSGRAFEREPVRLQVALPADTQQGTVVVRDGTAEVPCQIEVVEGKPVLWVAATLAPTTSVTYAVSSGKPAATPAVKIVKAGDQYLLDNGNIAVKVPAASSVLVGPVTAFRAPNGTWLGGSTWQTALKLTSLTTTVVGDGTVFAKLRLRYDFDGLAGLDGDVPAFAEVDVTLAPGWKHVELFERHAMGPEDAWTLELSSGWAPRQGVSRPFSSGFAGATQADAAPPQDRDLTPVSRTYLPPDLFINLFPRWNQHCKDGWAFHATDGISSAGAVVVRASRWVWPHQNSLRAVVKPSGDYAGLRCPTWKGQRLWWIVASPEPVDVAYVAAHAWEHLDKLNNEMILDWNGNFGKIPSINFYNNDEINPTGGIRRRGKSAMAEAGKPGDWKTLAEQQVRMHSDAYGSYWNYWSPENPNFFTDFYKIPIAMASNLKSHPRFAEIRKQAEDRFLEDLHHSAVLPGGAGQECPGYFSYALSGHLRDLAELCRQHLGFDPASTERFKAGLRFLDRVSQPDGEVRRMLPMGDTHPGPEGPKVVEVPNQTATSWRTEEFPGFGVIFNSLPGTPEETYVAFKSGPNRGHYHGDQLALHYCAHARPLAVDHHCSYHPRAGQEHMHNRVAFWNDEFPYANMDGFERVIGFKTSPVADVAIGQVESVRLRKVERLPPEMWHQEYPQIALAKPLIYRRTVVLVKAQPNAYVVLRDQFWGATGLNATFCLHVLGDRIEQQGATVDFGSLQLYCASPAATSFESFPWAHDNGRHEATQGARLTQRVESGEFVTVLYPGALPAVSPLPHGVKVGDAEIVFGGTEPTDGGDTVYVRVHLGGKEAVSLVGKDVDLNRSQGDVGLFVPDAGYPFGETPDWLIRQRNKVPDTAPAWAGVLPDGFERNSPTFRGPAGSGAYRETGRLPTAWNERGGTGVLWKAQLELPGWASPVVWGDKVIVLAADAQRRRVMCFEAASGKPAWTSDLPVAGGASEYTLDTQSDPWNSRMHAAATPATDGTRVFALFSNGQLAALDLRDGKVLWAVNLGDSNGNAYGLANSPLLFGDRVIVVFQGESSFIAAYDVATGKEIWKTERRSPSWASPILIRTAAGKYLIVLPADPDVTAWDPETGSVVWKTDVVTASPQYCVGPSPVFSDGLVVVNCENNGIVGIDPENGQPVWRLGKLPNGEGFSDGVSMTTDGKHIYQYFNRTLTCVEARTGRVVAQKETDDSSSYASPVYARGNLYLFGSSETLVLKADAAADFPLVGKGMLVDSFESSPAVADGRLFIRTDDSLYCLGTK